MSRPVCWIDIEGTGAQPGEDRIIVLALIKTQNGHREEYEWKFNPGMPSKPEAIEAHGITDDMVLDWPPFEKHAKEIYEIIRDCDVGGYNALGYDCPMLHEALYVAGIDWDIRSIYVLDPFQIFRIKEPRDLTAAVSFFCGKKLEGAHDAMNDIRATIDVMKGEFEKYEDVRGMTRAQLAEFCQGDSKRVDLAGKIVLNKQGIPCWNFGKSKGTPVSKDKSFGEWLLRNSFTEDTKQHVRRLIYGEPSEVNQKQLL